MRDGNRMKKLLFVGRFNQYFETLNRELCNFFEVQICPDNVEAVKGIMRMSKPDAILISAGELEESSRVIFTQINKERGGRPFFGVGTKEEIELIQNFPESEGIKTLTSPIPVRNIVAAVNESLGVPKRESAKKPLTSGLRPDRAVSRINRRKKILLVDDANVQLRAMENMLKKDYDVWMAMSGAEAIGMVKKNRPDLILLDYNMPGCSGTETFELLQEEENGRDVPVVFVTGVNEKDRIMEALKLKPEGYLVKPVKREELLDMVQKIFEKYNG